MEPFELHSYGITRLPRAAKRAGLEHVWFPIADLSIPASMTGAGALVDTLLRRLGEGKTVVVHCLAGLGRSGTIAACLLVAKGRKPDDAIQVVRAARPGAGQTRSSSVETIGRMIGIAKGVRRSGALARRGQYLIER